MTGTEIIAVAAGGAAITTLSWRILVGLFRLYKWISSINQKLTTENGHTVGQYVEDASTQLDRLEEKIDQNTAMGQTNRALIDSFSERLDKFIIAMISREPVTVEVEKVDERNQQ